MCTYVSVELIFPAIERKFEVVWSQHMAQQGHGRMGIDVRA